MALALCLGLAVGQQAAWAETITVDSPSITNSTAAIGNIVLISSSAQLRVAAGTGAVTFPSGTATRISGSGAAPLQTVTVTCASPPQNCKNTYKVFVSQVSVTGRATGISSVNASNPTAVSGSLSFSASTPEASPSAATPLFTVTSTSNTFSFTFRIGSTATLGAGAGNAAGWTYRVQVTK